MRLRGVPQCSHRLFPAALPNTPKFCALHSFSVGALAAPALSHAGVVRTHSVGAAVASAFSHGGAGREASDLALPAWCGVNRDPLLAMDGYLAAGRSSALWARHSLPLLWLQVPHIPYIGHAGQVDGFSAAHAGKRSLQELDDPRLDQQVSMWTASLHSIKLPHELALQLQLWPAGVAFFQKT